MNKNRFGHINDSRHGFLKKAGIATMATHSMLSNSCQTRNNPYKFPIQFIAVSDPDYTNMPEDDEIFHWINDLWENGDRSKYRFRMAGTKAGPLSLSTDYLINNLSSFGIANVHKKTFPIPAVFPEKKSLIVYKEALKQIACAFVDIVRALDEVDG